MPFLGYLFDLQLRNELFFSTLSVRPIYSNFYGMLRIRRWVVLWHDCLRKSVIDSRTWCQVTMTFSIVLYSLSIEKRTNSCAARRTCSLPTEESVTNKSTDRIKVSPGWCNKISPVVSPSGLDKMAYLYHHSGSFGGKSTNSQHFRYMTTGYVFRRILKLRLALSLRLIE